MLSYIAVPDPDLQRDYIALEQEMPSPIDIPAGCRFHPRCPVAEPRCSRVKPPSRELEPGWLAAWHLL